MSKSKSSKKWLERQHSDPYVEKARKEGLRSRAAFKLLEIQAKDKIIKPGMVVVDLGAAPGSWSEVAVKLVKNEGKVFALDILPMEPIANVEFIQGDFTDDKIVNELLQSIDKLVVDLVICDMAPNISGIKTADQARSMSLAELALDFANKVLKPNGSLLVKVFQGEGFDEFLKGLRDNFDTVKVRKPKASRPKSKELYLLAKR